MENLFNCENIKEIQKLDIEFNENMINISKNLIFLKKHEKIKVDFWIKKLYEFTSNLIWKRNRHKYTKLLSKMLKNNLIKYPFDKFPPKGHLPNFDKISFQVIKFFYKTRTFQ